MASIQKSLQKVDKTQFSPLWWVFLCGFNRFKPGGLNWVGFYPSNPELTTLQRSSMKKLENPTNPCKSAHVDSPLGGQVYRVNIWQ